MKKRNLDVVVISDVHLGTYDCHADELIAYLNSIEPKKLVLNGDIVDIWQFSKGYFPSAHLKVIRKIITMASKGTEVVYITGNHDDVLRKFSGTCVGNLSIENNLILELDGKKAWIFHGDVFDIPVKQTRWLAKLGGFGYGFLILLNRFVNWILQRLGREKYSLSKKIKNSVKNAVKLIHNFENTATELAIEQGYDYVICGHIHHPKKEIRMNSKGQCTYLNSGDWVEHLTALEYSFKRWKIYRYNYDKFRSFSADKDLKEMDMNDLIASVVDSNSTTINKKKDRASVRE